MRWTLSSPSLIESMLQLGDQVLDVLDADRKADQSIADAEARAHVLRQRRMRHDRRVLDQALDAAEALGQREELAALEEALGCRQPTLENRRNHATVALVHLLRREQVLRMAREPGIDHALDLRMFCQPGGDVHGVAAMALHAQRQRLDAAQREEGIERARHAPD